MQPIQRNIPVLLVLAIGLAGCGGGGGNAGTTDTDFTAFVKDQLAATSDTTEPTTVNERDFRFEDQDDPDAYNDVL